MTSDVFAGRSGTVTRDMGLFRKRDDEQISALRAEVRAVQEQLERTEQGKVELESQLVRLEERNATLIYEVATVDELRKRLDELSDRLGTPLEAPSADPVDAPDGAPDRSLSSGSAPPPPPLTAPTISVDDSRIDRIEERLAALDESRTEADEKLGEIAAQTARIDDRVTNISTELANQLTELSTDIDYVSQGLPTGSGATPIDPEVIEAKLQQRIDEEIDAKLGIELDEVRTSAERLAMEQARYEIRFRQDLAELADRIRRPARLDDRSDERPR
jgi:septal ring factor EnvC (AmiA/AmiB activator)